MAATQSGYNQVPAVGLEDSLYRLTKYQATASSIHQMPNQVFRNCQDNTGGGGINWEPSSGRLGEAQAGTPGQVETE